MKRREDERDREVVITTEVGQKKGRRNENGLVGR